MSAFLEFPPRPPAGFHKEEPRPPHPAGRPDTPLPGTPCSRLEGGVSALDGRASPECGPAGPAARGLSVPGSGHGLLPGSGSHPPRALGFGPGGDGLRPRKHLHKGGQRRPPRPLGGHLRRPLLLQLPRRGHLQGRGHAVEPVAAGGARAIRTRDPAPADGTLFLGLALITLSLDNLHSASDAIRLSLLMFIRDCFV